MELLESVRTQPAGADAAAPSRRPPWGCRSPGALHGQQCLQEKQHMTSHTLAGTRRRELDDMTGIGDIGAPTQCTHPSNAATMLTRCDTLRAGASRRRGAPVTASKRSCHDGGGGRHAGRMPSWPHAAADPAGPGLGLQPWLLLMRLAAGAAAGVSLLSRRRLRLACTQGDPGSAPSPADTQHCFTGFPCATSFSCGVKLTPANDSCNKRQPCRQAAGASRSMHADTTGCSYRTFRTYLMHGQRTSK